MTGAIDVKSITITIETLAAILGAIAAIWGTVYFTYRFLCKWVRIAISANRIHSEFGDSAFNRLVDIVQKNQVAIEQIYIRTHISERLHNIGIYVCDPEGKCTWANDWLCEAFGLDSHNMHGFGWLAAIKKSEQPRVYDSWTNAIKQHTPYIEDYQVHPPNQKTSWTAHTEAWPILIDEKLICYVGHVLKTI